MKHFRRLGILAAFVGFLASPPVLHATDVTGTVTFQGQVVFAAPIAGIAPQDITVAVKAETEATGNGEQCEITVTTSDNADATGAYPDAGTVSATITISHGGPQVPDGDCIVTLQAAGDDGVSVSARGSQTIFVSAADIGASAVVAVPDITVRQSNASAGIDTTCQRWVKKQLRFRSRCNFLLLKGGPALASRCRDASLDEPAGCDPGEHVGAVLALSHGDNDQQVDPPSAEGVDFAALGDEVVCQKRLGRAAFVFLARRTKLVEALCVETGLDSADCRADRSRDAKPKLDSIDRCVNAQATDVGTGRVVPDVGAPCESCLAGGTVDRKCLKDCFRQALDELSDGLVGDLPVCGNGIVQASGGETCDDGNTTGGDGCSATCQTEP